MARASLPAQMRSRLLPDFSGRPRPATAQFAQAWAVHLAQMTAYIDAVQRGDQAAAHGQALAAAVNAQADDDWSTAYARNREATDHARTVSDTIVQATVQKYPQTFAS